MKNWAADTSIQLEATRLSKSWAIRPLGAVGTHGWSPVPWEVIYICAPTAQQAILRARTLAPLFSSSSSSIGPAA
jgi:hypothetical protein